VRDVSLPLVPRMTMREQVAEAAYLLYADGHVAAGRYGTLMHTGRVILRIATEQPECGQLWAFYGTVGAVVDEDTIHATVPADADHFVIDAQLRNLRSTVLYLRANEAVATRVAACARRKAPTIESIAQYWRYAISAISQRQQQRRHAADATDAAAYAWFCAVDPEYASTTASMTLKPM
jgi:prepilin-type processing-associated H-X9-DG protein